MSTVFMVDVKQKLTRRDARRKRDLNFLPLNFAMVPDQLATLYQNLKRAFDARPSDLRKCGTLLAQLKVSNRPPCFSALNSH